MTMKRLILAALFAAGAALMGPRPAYADSVALEADLINNPTIAYSTTVALNLAANEVDTLSLQSIYSSATISTFNLDDGRKATGTITVLSTSSLTTARLVVGSCVFDQGGAWSVGATTAATADNIATAMNASPCLSGVVTSTRPAPGAVIFSTASTIGTAGNSLALLVFNTSSITVSGATLSNGDDSSFSVADDEITTSAGHGISTGAPLLFNTVTGTAPTGLTTATTYYAIVTANNKFKLATSSANSLAGTAVDITALTGSGTFTAALTAYSGTYSFKFQASNDGTNWSDISGATVTYSAPGSTLTEITLVTYKWLRLNFTTGAGGGLNLRVAAFGRRRGG